MSTDYNEEGSEFEEVAAVPVDPPQLFLGNKTYDALKLVALVLLPGLGAFYFGLSQIWGLPKGEEVSGTVLLLDTLLGGILKFSTRTYRKAVE